MHSPEAYMKRFGLTLIFMLGATALADAAAISLSRTSRAVTAAEVADGAPAGGFVHEFFVNSDSDLLCVGADPFGATFFNHTLGSDVAPPSPADVSANPALGTNSFIALPSETSRLGGGFSSASGERVWFDLSKDGPQQNFMFARFTTTGQTASFTGNIFAWGYDAPVHLPFSFALPGTEADLALLVAEPDYSLEYSLDPPPAPIPLPVVPETVPTTPSIPEPLPAPPEVPLVIHPPATAPPVPEQPPVVDPPATPAEPEVPIGPPETPIHVILPGFQIGLTYDLEITPIHMGWNRYWRLTSDLLDPTRIDLTTFDGDLKITDGTGLVALTSFETTGELYVTTSFNVANSRLTLNRAGFASATAASTQIPEPSTALLAATALFALSAARRR